MHTQTHTPTRSKALALLSPALSLSECAQDCRVLWHTLYEKSFLPSLLSVPSCQPPPHPSVCSCAFDYFHPLVQLPAPHCIWSGMAHSPLWSLFFPLHCEWCEMQWLRGIVPICEQHIQSLRFLISSDPLSFFTLKGRKIKVMHKWQW